MNFYNYGYSFNDFIIKDNIIIKKFKNELGKYKINNEINFYKFINEKKINFNMPKLIEYDDGELKIEYIKNSKNLVNVINNNNVTYIINKIIYSLNYIHNINKNVYNNIILDDIKNEIIEKNIKRYNEYDWNNDKLLYQIKYVNNIEIKNIEYYLNKIYKRLIILLKNRNKYNLIHGDTHLGNILIDDNENLYFIDPRGYFGNSKLYGLKEYDYAKLLFGLSGYSYFDTININNLEIVNNNINIEFIHSFKYTLELDIFNDEIIKLLFLSIWLGNNSSFIDINKKIMSLMIAFYYCEIYFNYFY